MTGRLMGMKLSEYYRNIFLQGLNKTTTDGWYTANSLGPHSRGARFEPR
jgi:hypothetical protein